MVRKVKAGREAMKARIVKVVSYSGDRAMVDTDRGRFEVPVNTAKLFEAGAQEFLDLGEEAPAAPPHKLNAAQVRIQHIDIAIAALLEEKKLLQTEDGAQLFNHLSSMQGPQR